MFSMSVLDCICAFLIVLVMWSSLRLAGDSFENEHFGHVHCTYVDRVLHLTTMDKSILYMEKIMKYNCRDFSVAPVDMK